MIGNSFDTHIFGSPRAQARVKRSGALAPCVLLSHAAAMFSSSSSSSSLSSSSLSSSPSLRVLHVMCGHASRLVDALRLALHLEVLHVRLHTTVSIDWLVALLEATCVVRDEDDVAVAVAPADARSDVGAVFARASVAVPDSDKTRATTAMMTSPTPPTTLPL